MARNLKECLVLQLKERERYDPVMARFIDNLELVARARLRRTAEGLRVSTSTTSRAWCRRCAASNPKPGNAFGSVGDPADRARCDRQGGPGRRLAGRAELGNPAARSRQPAVLRESSARGAGPETDKTYLSDCHVECHLAREKPRPAGPDHPEGGARDRAPAGWLSGAGVEALRPLNLRTVADAIAMHELTVSRVTSNKYMADASRHLRAQVLLHHRHRARRTASPRIPRHRCGTGSGNDRRRNCAARSCRMTRSSLA